MATLKYIVYVSQAKKPFSSDGIRQLLRYSRARNDADEITGLLVYRYNADFDRGNFIQILEGPDEAIENVWSRISNDGRHHTIIVVEEGTNDKRMFGSWSMGFKNVDADDLQQFEGFADLGSDEFWQNVNPDTLSEAMNLLKSFIGHPLGLDSL